WEQDQPRAKDRRGQAGNRLARAEEQKSKVSEKQIRRTVRQPGCRLALHYPESQERIVSLRLVEGMGIEMVQPQRQGQPKEGEVEKIFQCQNSSLIIHAHPV